MNFIDISILDAAVRCGIQVDKNSNRTEVNANCPFCDDKRKHASLNTAKNLFHCHRCGEGHNPVSLYAKLIGTDTKIAYHELTSGDFPIFSHSSLEHEREPKALLERHNIYSELLNMLSLSHKHKTNLLNRGLDSSAIEWNMYRTVPDKVQAEHIIEVLSEHYDLTGIPGFYTGYGKWRIFHMDGLFIPVRSYNGLIQGLQIRLDNTSDRKYRWFSSRYKENGTRAYSWAHVANWKNNGSVYVTEGPLKSDVAAYLSGDCFIGLSGVNCIDSLVPLLQSMNIKAVYECFDMDKTTNRHVKSAVVVLKTKLQSVGISCKPMYWDKMTNGVDDYYQFTKWLDERAA